MDRFCTLLANLSSPLEPAGVPAIEVEISSSAESRGANGATSMINDGRGPYLRFILPGYDKKLPENKKEPIGVQACQVRALTYRTLG